MFLLIVCFFFNHLNIITGNEKYLIRLLIPVVTFLGLAAFVLSVLVSNNGDENDISITNWSVFIAVSGFYAGLNVLFVVFQVYKLQALYDTFAVKDEILLFSKWTMGCGMMMLVVFIFGLIVDEPVLHWCNLIVSGIVAVAVFGMGYIQTKWVLNNVNSTQSTEQHRKQLLLQKDNDGNSKDNTNDDDNDDDIWSLSTFLGNQDGFNVFMNYLLSQYAARKLITAPL